MTSLYIVFVDANEVGSEGGTESQFSYGTTINNTTGQINKIGTCPSSVVGDFFTGTSFPQVVSPDVTDDITTLYVQGGGTLLNSNWVNGYVFDKNFSAVDPHDFGICSGSSLGNFLYHDGSNGGTSYNIVSNDPSLMPYKIYLRRPT
jgi:hypothetical protein